jgi:hypothetical protein
MGAIQTLEPVAAPTTPASAVAWIDDRNAIVASLSITGGISTCEISRGTEAEPSYIALVVRAIGDRERVVILGPSSMRLSLEREYVTIYRRPDRLIDVEPAGPAGAQELIDRVRALAA